MESLSHKLLQIVCIVDCARSYLEGTEPLLSETLQESGFTITYNPDGLPKEVVPPPVYKSAVDGDNDMVIQLANDLEMLRKALPIISQVVEDTQHLWEYTRLGD